MAQVTISRDDDYHDEKVANIEALVAQHGGRITGHDWLGNDHTLHVEGCDKDGLCKLKLLQDW